MSIDVVRSCCCRRGSEMAIPSADSFPCPQRAGFLEKLVGRNFLFAGQWKTRYCVLSETNLYFYDNQKSTGGEKSSGVVHLESCEGCEEAQEKKKEHVFTITLSSRGFFDSRHLFAAESAAELESWSGAIQESIADSKRSRSSSSRSKHNSLGPPAQEVLLPLATKDRPRGPQGRRLPQRRSMMPATGQQSPDAVESRTRSFSLSSPLPENQEIENKPSEGDRLSASLEEVVLHEEGEVVPQMREAALSHQQRKRPVLLGQYSALTRELEAKIRPRRGESADIEETAEEVDADRLQELSRQAEATREALSALEVKVGALSSTTAQGTGDLLLKVTVALQEAERMNGECRRALEEANKARDEYQALARECKDAISQLSGTPKPGVNGHANGHIGEEQHL